MKIHKRLITLVGLGILLIVGITVLSLLGITAEFSRTTRSMGFISLEVRKIWTIEQRIGDATRMVHEYVETSDPRFRHNYETFRDLITRMLDEIKTFELAAGEATILAALQSDFREVEDKASQIFSLNLADRQSRAVARGLMADLTSLVVWMEHDLERYKEESAVRTDALAQSLGGTRRTIVILFTIVLLTSGGFLFGLGVYLYRKVSQPLAQLWEGTAEISQGNLDYRVQVHGENDVVQLAERFNEMARKLQLSYTDLEERLLQRTKQLTALNSVALALGQGGSLREVLQRSLSMILQSFPEMEPKGGIFLCERDGEALRLVAHVGLPAEFAAREERIRMGECLCGVAAQTGELIYADQGCRDPRHTRHSPETAAAHVVIPIKSRGLVLGVMFLYPTKAFALKPSDLQMFDTVGAELGMAVENLRLYGEVKESSHRYWDLFEKSRDILFTVDLNGVVTSANEAMEQFTGKTKATLIGGSILDFLTEESRTLARRILAGQEQLADRMYEFEVVRPDGTNAFVEVSGRVLQHKQQPTGFQLAARDVTEQKNLRELLVQAERLSAIGQIVVAVRHEINNPLTTVIGNAELLLDRHGTVEGDLKRRLETILDNSLRISEIIKRLQEIKQVKTVDYVRGVKMTDLGKR